MVRNPRELGDLETQEINKLERYDQLINELKGKPLLEQIAVDIFQLNWSQRSDHDHIYMITKLLKLVFDSGVQAGKEQPK